MIYKIINKTKSITLSQQAQVADSFFKRFWGLMFKKHIDKDEALIFYRAQSIHTFFMRFPIDVIFLDKNMRVIKIYQGLKPFRFAASLKSAITIELPPYKTFQIPTEVGDILELEAS